MTTFYKLGLMLGYNPRFGRSNPMPDGLCNAMGTDVEVMEFRVKQFSEEFYEVTIEYVNVRGANGNFDFTESVAGRIGTTHRLTYGRHLQLLSEGENLLHIAISKD